MGAPASAYFLIDSKFIGPNEVEMTVNPAKAQAVLATLKSRFYLDDVIGFTANYGGVLYHGFWGTVKSGGFNYQHHKTTRILAINGDKPAQILRTFNDAGLNTKGNATLVDFTISSESIILDFLSAFYLDSDTYGITVDKDVIGNDDSVISTSYEINEGFFLAQQGAHTGTIWLGSDLSIAFGKKQVNLYVRGFIENAEGRFTTLNRYMIVSEYNKASYDFDRSNPFSLKFTVTLVKPLKKASMWFTTDIYIDYYDEDGFLQSYLYDDGYILLYQGQSSGEVGVSLPPEIDPNLIDAVMISPQDEEFSEISYYDQTV